MRCFPITALAAFFSLCAVAENCRAEYLPPFDLDYCIQQATTIVAATVGGDEPSFMVIAGTPIEAKDAHIPLDRQMRDAMGIKDLAHYEVVAFLDQDGNPVLGFAGVVGIRGDDVYLWVDADFRGGAPRRYGRYTRKTFFEAVDRAVEKKRRRLEILAREPAEDRARAAVTFVLEHGVGAGEAAHQNPQLQRAEIARGLAPIDEREQAVILAAIERAENDAQRAALLQLAGAVPLSEAAFDPIVERLDRLSSRVVRVAAAEAASSIDNDRAAGRLVPLLTLEDPDVIPLLRSLHDPRRSGGEWARNPLVVDALIGLAGQYRALHMTDGRHAHGNEGYALLHAMQFYFHPRMLPVLHDWAVADDHVSSNQALSNLGQLTGLSIERGATAAYDDWWATARDTVMRRYDLPRDDDLVAWLAAYHDAGDTTRRMLQQLWLFERLPDAKRLLDHAADTDPKRSVGAKAALAELWQNKRLAPDVKRAIVEKFLEVNLVETPNSPEASGYRHLLIVAQRNFPFPRDAWVEPNCEIAVDRELPPLGDSWGAFSLEGEGEKTLGSWSGGSRAGTPQARALMVLREVDYYAIGGKTELWRIQWRLGPQKLRPAR
jgi:hypothetical protein